MYAIRSYYAADAVYQNLDILRVHKPEYVLILAGDHIYKMDYGEMVASHVRNEADMTVACIDVPIQEASSFGVMAADDEGRVVSFLEKPANPPPKPGNPRITSYNVCYTKLLRQDPGLSQGPYRPGLAGQP